MGFVRKCRMAVLTLCLLLGLAGCSTSQETAIETQIAITPETLPVPLETLAETVPAETVPAEVTEPEPEPEPVAAYIDAGVRITLDGSDITRQMREPGYRKVAEIRPNQTLAVESEEAFSALYVEWDSHPGSFTLVWEDGSLDCGEEGFLHDYIRLPEAVTGLTFQFQEEGKHRVGRLDVFTYGTAPEGVQDWQLPCETADILVFPTHADDDTLFFGAVISYYAIEKGLTVQTAFLTDHYYEPFRNHERLNGLWEMGVRHYPILTKARDYSTKSLKEAEIFHRNDGLLEWQVEQIRRFEPLVILGHDIEGEYGHGQHKLNTHYLIQAVELAADEAQFPESAQQYGLWDAPKLYLHLYEENRITFNVNTPMEQDASGRTPFEVAQDAYLCHVSQQKYSYCVSQDPNSAMDCTHFGLYRTLVGYDTGNDLMEHTTRDS